MDNQNGAAQLHYLEEIGIRLRRMGFETMPVEDQHLPIKWNGSDLCRISGRGSVLYRQENVDSIRSYAAQHQGNLGNRRIQEYCRNDGMDDL